jgi:hypothetical protein
MRETDSDQILFGPGGEILDVSTPDSGNQKLIEQIRKAKSLLPVELIKLATFFRAYPTNASLGDHLLLSALEMMVTHPQLQEQLQAINNVTSGALDVLEDFFDCEGEMPGDLDNAAEDAFGCHLFRWVLFSSAGLLIEAQFGKGKTSFFVIGVSPSPASLPFPS